MPIPIVHLTDTVSGGDYDAVIAISGPKADFASAEVVAAVTAVTAIDAAAGCNVYPAPALAGGRLVYVPTGPISRDFDDVRRLEAAAKDGVRRAIKAGCRAPVLVVSSDAAAAFKEGLLVTILGALWGAYVPLSTREAKGEAETEVVSKLGVSWPVGPEEEKGKTVATALAIEKGKRIARDLTNGDPERMAPPGAAQFCVEAFAGVSGVSVSVVDSWEEIEAGYPLAAAVGRASAVVPRHAPRIVKLEYKPSGTPSRHVVLVGKGICYDTGGADVKAGGIMAGMKRDKGGASSVTGFVRTVAELAPADLAVTAYCGWVRNSIGEESYVADEVITSRAGKRVLVVNTDAEGRMVMADLLSDARATAAEAAGAGQEVSIHTMATLTGHAVLAHGKYGAAVDNGPARARGTSRRLQDLGLEFGDNFEVSYLRPDDYAFVAPKTSEYDVLQCNTAPSSRTMRGHQFPAAFLIRASGLDEHGSDSAVPLAYTHLDIAGAADTGAVGSGEETGCAVTTLTAHYILRA
jgi:leucyl aminopeptidase